MNIQSISYLTPEQDLLRVVTDDGTLDVPWPCQTWHRELIEVWLADGGEIAAYAPPPPVFPPLSARQLRLGLVMNGIALSQVEAAIAAIEDPDDKAIAEIEWEYASAFLRDHPLIEQVGSALGLTTEQIDTMWMSAIAL